jgi:hypothetical protein
MFVADLGSKVVPHLVPMVPHLLGALQISKSTIVLGASGTRIGPSIILLCPCGLPMDLFVTLLTLVT